jgi:hypothetical protein
VQLVDLLGRVAHGRPGVDVEHHVPASRAPPRIVSMSSAASNRGP